MTPVRSPKLEEACLFGLSFANAGGAEAGPVPASLAAAAGSRAVGPDGPAAPAPPSKWTFRLPGPSQIEKNLVLTCSTILTLLTWPRALPQGTRAGPGAMSANIADLDDRREWESRIRRPPAGAAGHIAVRPGGPASPAPASKGVLGILRLARLLVAGLHARLRLLPLPLFACPLDFPNARCASQSKSTQLRVRVRKPGPQLAEQAPQSVQQVPRAKFKMPRHLPATMAHLSDRAPTRCPPRGTHSRRPARPRSACSNLDDARLEGEAVEPGALATAGAAGR